MGRALTIDLAAYLASRQDALVAAAHRSARPRPLLAALSRHRDLPRRRRRPGKDRQPAARSGQPDRRSAADRGRNAARSFATSTSTPSLTAWRRASASTGSTARRALWFKWRRHAAQSAALALARRDGSEPGTVRLVRRFSEPLRRRVLLHLQTGSGKPDDAATFHSHLFPGATRTTAWASVTLKLPRTWDAGSAFTPFLRSNGPRSSGRSCFRSTRRCASESQEMRKRFKSGECGFASRSQPDQHCCFSSG